MSKKATIAWESWNAIVDEILNEDPVSILEAQLTEEEIEMMENMLKYAPLEPAQPKVLYTPYGLFAAESMLKPSNRWDCWFCYTSFDITNTMVKNIEEIEVGDLVWAWDDAEKSLSAQKVTKTFVHENDDDLLILNDLVYVTPNHPIYLDGDWVPAGDLESGDILITVSLGKEGHNLFERRLKSITQYENHVGKVYNFKVEKLHNYFADGILVHNKPP